MLPIYCLPLWFNLSDPAVAALQGFHRYDN